MDQNVASKSTRAAELVGRVAELQAKYPPPSQVRTAERANPVFAALDQFMECVRYLNTRRSEARMALDSEAAVQDLLFFMLRSCVPDLVPESPTDRVASRYTIKDFRSVSLRTIVEAKFVRDKDHGKSISREIHDDIETYRTDPMCETLIFFIYDPDVNIPDRGALKRHVEVERTYAGRSLSCHVLVHP